MQKMNVGKDEMEEGEVSSSDGEDLGGYTPLQVCSSANSHPYCQLALQIFLTFYQSVSNSFPSQRPTNPKPHSQPPAPTQGLSTQIKLNFSGMISLLPDYDSDEDPPCLPGDNSGSDSEDDEKNGRPAAKTSRPGSSTCEESGPIVHSI